MLYADNHIKQRAPQKAALCYFRVISVFPNLPRVQLREAPIDAGITFLPPKVVFGGRVKNYVLKKLIMASNAKCKTKQKRFQGFFYVFANTHSKMGYIYKIK